MVNVISVKFKGGGKCYYFAPCPQPLEKGMGVIVETSKGLEYATVTEGVHEVDESQIVPPLMPVVRIATQKDMEQIQRNEARKDEAMKTVREKIEARGLDMKPVGCEFSFDGTKVVIYFTAENRVDFRELIKDLSSAFRMRIELRQIGIREEIKLMGGLAPCGRECCCVRSLQEPKKVSVKMAKNQGLSLNPGKISGLCGRLMCCLSFENDYYAEVCKKVPKLGSEANTPDGKGMVVNVNMLKMTVKVKIEQGESVTYKDFPLDKISFMRGNEVIGSVGGDEDEPEEEAVEEQIFDRTESAVEEEAAGGNGGERRQGEKRNNGKGNGDKHNRRNGNQQDGNQQNGEQSTAPVQGGKNRNKNRRKQNGKRKIESNGGEQGTEGKQGAGAPKQNRTGVKANGQGGHTNANGQPRTDGDNQAVNTSNGQGNSNRNRKKRRSNKNRGAKANNGENATESQKNNA
ncbi:MAG: regulatory iron-sulfur-containing complex subunit RicT [Candidatus Coproplasma sp.]